MVNIYAKIVTQGRASPFAGDPFFEQFFGDFGQPRKRVQNSLGSGVILTPGGIVVSNYHVVGMATEIRVVTTDRREYKAKVLLGDKDSDLAILQLLDAPELPFLELRDSEQVEVGELVLAIGNPASFPGWPARVLRPGASAAISSRPMRRSTRAIRAGR